MKFVGTVRKVGRYLTVEIPAHVVKRLRLEPGDPVELTVHSRKKSLEALRGIGPFAHENHAEHG